MAAGGLQRDVTRRALRGSISAPELVLAGTSGVRITLLSLALLVLAPPLREACFFGQSSEKLDHDIEQLELLIGDLEEDASEGEARAKAVVTALHGRTGTAERRHPVRKPLPEHLPREVITLDPVSPG